MFLFIVINNTFIFQAMSISMPQPDTYKFIVSYIFSIVQNCWWDNGPLAGPSGCGEVELSGLGALRCSINMQHLKITQTVNNKHKFAKLTFETGKYKFGNLSRPSSNQESFSTATFSSRSSVSLLPCSLTRDFWRPLLCCLAYFFFYLWASSTCSARQMF